VEAQKAGRVEGTSRLKVQLTDLTLVDGQVIPVQSQLISRNGPTSVGRDAGAIAGTTAVGRGNWRGRRLGNGRCDRRGRWGGRRHDRRAVDAWPSDDHWSESVLTFSRGSTGDDRYRSCAAGISICCAQRL